LLRGAPPGRLEAAGLCGDDTANRAQASPHGKSPADNFRRPAGRGTPSAALAAQPISRRGPFHNAPKTAAARAQVVV